MRYQIELSIVTVLTVLLVSCEGISNPTMLVEYQRVGGFASLDDHVVIDTSGKTTLRRKGVRSEFVLSSDVADHLRSILGNARFSELKKEYQPPHPGNDLFEYTVTYQGYTIRMADTAIPESL